MLRIELEYFVPGMPTFHKLMGWENWALAGGINNRDRNGWFDRRVWGRLFGLAVRVTLTLPKRDAR